MIYRTFGNTGEKISTLGFGCMRLPEVEKNEKWSIDLEKSDEMLLRAVELGVNYFDTAPYYCHSNSEAAVGHALKSVRDRVLISTKCPVGDCKGEGAFRRMLEQSLTRLETDHIDFYHFWGIGGKCFDEEIIGTGMLQQAAQAKEEGLIRHISFSFHDDPKNIRYIIDRSKEVGIEVESLLAQYNLLDRSNEEMIAYAASQGLGTVAMGPVGGGRLSAPTDLYSKLTGKPPIATYELAFRFVLGNPSLCCALSGMQNLEMVEQNARIASDETPFSESEWKQLGEAMEQIKKFSDLYCTGCKYCQPCPAGIDIPRIFGAFTYHNVYGLTEHAKNEMDKYIKDGGKTLKDCLDCGLCEKKCPQKLPIRADLKRVESTFEALKN